MDQLSPSSASALIDAMRFREARAGVLAGNLANVDTPGYRRRDLVFVEALDSAMGGLAAGDADPVSRHRLELGPKGHRIDGNGVNLDEEAIAFSRNAGAFTKQASILARIEALTKTAITGQ